MKTIISMILLMTMFSYGHEKLPAFVPEVYHFQDDGIIPNNKLPLLLYRQAFTERGEAGVRWLEQKFKSNGWYNSWRWGIYPFHHYHSNTHEVLGVFRGTATVMLGGAKGKTIHIKAGDIIVIPAGVGHKCLSHSSDFTVVGAYPDGMSPDLIREEPTKHAASLEKISHVPLPKMDPLLGNSGGLIVIWENK